MVMINRERWQMFLARYFLPHQMSLGIQYVLLSTGLTAWLQRRVEIESPVTSWFRVQECVMLSKLKISPYSGDICHQPPFIVMFFQNLPPDWVATFFQTLNVVTGILLSYVAECFIKRKLKQQEEEKASYAAGTELIWLKENAFPIWMVVLCVYLLNPYTIVTCAANSTTVINNFVNVLVLLAMCTGYTATASVLVAISTHLSLYHVMLLVPVALSLQKNQSKPPSLFVNAVKCLFTFTMATALLLVGSSMVYGSWDFVDAVYGFVLKAPDLTPNMGLFWYFFLEMFDHFRLFFLVVYQINIFIYVIPLSIVFRQSPMLLSYSLLSLVALFQSYSNIGHLSIPIAMLPLWSHLFPYTRNILLIAGMFFFTSLLAPCMWYLWIYAGMGNANFFYAVTLAYNTAQVFLLSDVLYAYLRHQFHLTNGISPKTKDGKEGIVTMK